MGSGVEFFGFKSQMYSLVRERGNTRVCVTLIKIGTFQKQSDGIWAIDSQANKVWTGTRPLRVVQCEGILYVDSSLVNN